MALETMGLQRMGRELGIFRRCLTTFPTVDRLQGSQPSIWVEFTKQAIECNAVNIGHGFPDYASCPRYVWEELGKAALDNKFNQYTRGFGHPALVTQLGELYSDLLSHPVDPMENILVTVGAYQALYYSIMAWVNPGDEVILLEPFYDCYEPQIRMAGGTPVGVPLTLDPAAGPNPTSASLKLDFDELERAFSGKTKMLIINNPNNPSGKLYTAEELTKIAELAVKHNVIVVADEVYEWVVYEPRKMIRFEWIEASLPGMWERTITIGSAGKAFSVTGWKLGWAMAPRPLLEQLEYVHQNCIYTSPITVQEAAARGFERERQALGSGKSYFESLSRELLPKREAMVAMCREAGLNPIVPESGYFLMADISSAKRHMGDFGRADESDDYRFVKWMTQEKKLAGIPCSAFYSSEHKQLGSNWIRFCFFKRDQVLSDAKDIMLKTFK